MIRINKLHLHNFRCFQSKLIELNQNFSWIVGDNAAGKTSILEAIYFFGHAKSFRTNNAIDCISNNTNIFQLKLYTSIPYCGYEKNNSLTIEKSINSSASFKVNNNIEKKISNFVKQTPVQLIDVYSYSLIEGGAYNRRQFLDWLGFYVVDGYDLLIKNFKKILEIRNFLIKTKKVYTEDFYNWNKQYINIAIQVDNARINILQLLQNKFQNLSFDLIKNDKFIFEYINGWGDQNLVDVLQNNLRAELERGYTLFGPHRADFAVMSNGEHAYKMYSRGQIKLLVALLYLSRIHVLTDLKPDTAMIFLVDDICAELDDFNLEAFLNALKATSCQTIITSIYPHKLINGDVIQLS